jgi:hypothetical protein
MKGDNVAVAEYFVFADIFYVQFRNEFLIWANIMAENVHAETATNPDETLANDPCPDNSDGFAR